VGHFTKRLVYGPLPIESQLYRALILIALNRRDDAMRLTRSTHGNSGAQPAIMVLILEILVKCGEAERAARIVSDFKLIVSESPVSKFRQALLVGA
jgi:hypothetical protein